MPNRIWAASAVSSRAKFIYPGPTSAVLASPGVPLIDAAVKLPTVITPLTESLFEGPVNPIPRLPPVVKDTFSLLAVVLAPHQKPNLFAPYPPINHFSVLWASNSNP